MKIGSPKLDSARATLYDFLNTPAADITPGRRATVAEVTQIGSRVGVALDLLDGRLDVDDIKISLSRTDHTHDEPITKV